MISRSPLGRTCYCELSTGPSPLRGPRRLGSAGGPGPESSPPEKQNQVSKMPPWRPAHGKGHVRNSSRTRTRKRLSTNCHASRKPRFPGDVREGAREGRSLGFPHAGASVLGGDLSPCEAPADYRSSSGPRWDLGRAVRNSWPRVHPRNTPLALPAALLGRRAQPCRRHSGPAGCGCLFP